MSDGEMHHGHEPDDPDQSIGIHGMLLVGETPMYLSHVPMFMPLRNYQVIHLFRAHQTGHRPSFDQNLRIAADGVHFTETKIDRQLRPQVAIPGRTDSPDLRLKAGEIVAAQSSARMHFQNDLQVNVLAQIYSNEDELR